MQLWCCFMYLGCSTLTQQERALLHVFSEKSLNGPAACLQMLLLKFTSFTYTLICSCFISALTIEQYVSHELTLSNAKSCSKGSLFFFFLPVLVALNMTSCIPHKITGIIQIILTKITKEFHFCVHPFFSPLLL